ncbi:MAG: hypothetical protein IPM02_26455 [Betaproteobacteria bacterium]|nr:hypothetical protein [Betaproteobacteria bacterium]
MRVVFIFVPCPVLPRYGSTLEVRWQDDCTPGVFAQEVPAATPEKSRCRNTAYPHSAMKRVRLDKRAMVNCCNARLGVRVE